MMKTKRALVSMIVFLTVFSLTSIFNIQLPLFDSEGIPAKVDEAIPADSGAMLEQTSDNRNGKLSATGEDQYLASKNIPLQYGRSVSQYDSFNEGNSAISTATEAEPPVKEEAADTTDGGTAEGQDSDTDTAAGNPKATEELSDAAADNVLTPDDTEAATDSTEAVRVPLKPLFGNIGISVAKDFVNIRKEPSTESEVLGKLYRDSGAEILSTEGDWYYVESGSVKGYAKADYIKTGLTDEELIENYSTQNICVAVDGLNVREESSIESRKLTVIYQNETYPVVEVLDEWILIEIPDENLTGYVKKDMAELEVAFKDAVSKEEEQLILQLQAEERARQETAVKQRDSVSYTEADLKLLACLVHSEAGTQSYEGKLAVANVVLNRIKSSKYPDSLKDVIYQSGQFSVAKSGSLQKQLDNYVNYSSKSQKLSIKAAKDALEGANNIGSRMYFHSYKAAVKKGYDSKSNSVKLGDHLFW